MAVSRSFLAGFSVLELVIAAAVGHMAISAVLLVAFTDQSSGSDSEITSRALHKASEVLEGAQALARASFVSVTSATSTDCSTGICYSITLSVPATTSAQCAKRAQVSVAWTAAHARSQKIELSTLFTDPEEMLALGGNCDTSSPAGTWNSPITCVSANFNPGKPTGLDVLDGMIYMSADQAPYLMIADARAVTAPACSVAPVFISGGSFTAENPLNDVRVARASNGHVYAFAASHSTAKQLRVYDVTSPSMPMLVASSSLASVLTSGSFPQGWRIFYYDGRVYIVTRETQGREFHVFDARTPWIPASIVELGAGFELNRTVESFTVVKRRVSGVDRLYAFMATDKNSAEVTVLDVTDPHAIFEVAAANRDLLGNQDAASVFLLGNVLYVGRNSSPGADLYVFDVSDPASGMPLLGSADVGAGVLGIAVSGSMAFLATTKSNKEVQVWRSDPRGLAPINTSFNFPNLVANGNGIRFRDPFLYVASQGNDAIRILHSP
jgi:hypothetical protein